MLRRACFAAFPLATLLTVTSPSFAADLIMNGGTVTLGGTQTYGTVSLTNGATINVPNFNGSDKNNTGNLVIKANSILIDATSKIVAKGAGYQAGLCTNGPGPAAFPASGGRGGCGVFDSGGGGAHFGQGGRGTKDCPVGGCNFPADYEEDCIGALAGNACASTTNCRNNDALPTVAGQPFWHSIYVPEFGAAGGDKGCRDGDGFSPLLATAGSGGGRIVLVAVNAGQTGSLTINGTINANGNRGCGINNDSGGGGAGGTVLLIGDSVNVGASAQVFAAGGRGGDSQAKSDPECAGTQQSGTCDDCGGGGGGGIISVLSRVASINPQATFNVQGAFGGVCPICTGEAGGGAGELQIDGAYVGEVCDGYDNDFDGTVDNGLPQLNCNGPMIPSCINGIPQTCPANVPACVGAVTDTRPRFAVIVDTSGSMLNDINGKPTYGDGSVNHLGVDTSSDADAVDGNNSRLYIAKQALSDVLAAFTNADFAIGRYHQDISTNRSCQTASWFECQKICCSYDDPRNNVTPAFPVPGCNLQTIYAAGYPAALNANINIGWPNQNDCINYAGSCGPPRRGADFVVGFGKPLQQSLRWLDGQETLFDSSVLPGDHCSFMSGGDCELRGTGPTPLAGSLQAAQDYLKPIIQCDGAVPCRKYATILLTDGAESCQGDPVAAATALRTAVAGTTINTYVIGFSTLPSETAQLNAVAAAGGTGTAFLANDKSSLANALATIVASSTVFEKCNNLDDDCDSLVDEDFPDKGAACDNGLKGICKGTGVLVCNAAQNGTTCQITNPGQMPKTEVCNGLDDNCNGLIDENGICQQCVPTPEVCNGLDDNCNAVSDDNPVDVGKPCGINLGICKPGTTACVMGVLQCAGSVGPVTETCNGLDDNCDGVVDGMTQPCYSGPMGTEGVGVCRAGTQACTAAVGSGTPMWGVCVGQVVPSAELCDGLDNDCNGLVDDMVNDGNGNVTGTPCCAYGTKCGQGICTYGVYACAGSQVVCDGGVGPSPETCNGVDDDCNGQPDDVPGVGLPCALPGGCPGMLECQAGVGLVCTAAATGLEVCNGIDDDCDGSIDEEPEVSQNDPQIGKACDAPVPPQDKPPCLAGTTACKSGQVVCKGAIGPTTELCDGIDNDCNGTIDEPNPCPGDLLCVNGACRSKCQGGEFPCPGGQICDSGVCIPVGGSTSSSSGAGGAGSGGGAGAGGDAGSGGMGGGTGGNGNTSSSSSSSSSSGNMMGGNGGASADDNVYGLPTGGGGCSCDMPGKTTQGMGALAALAGLGSIVARRRGASRKRG